MTFDLLRFTQQQEEDAFGFQTCKPPQGTHLPDLVPHHSRSREGRNKSERQRHGPRRHKADGYFGFIDGHGQKNQRCDGQSCWRPAETQQQGWGGGLLLWSSSSRPPPSSPHWLCSCVHPTQVRWLKVSLIWIDVSANGELYSTLRWLTASLSCPADKRNWIKEQIWRRSDSCEERQEDKSQDTVRRQSLHHLVWWWLSCSWRHHGRRSSHARSRRVQR